MRFAITLVMQHGSPAFGIRWVALAFALVGCASGTSDEDGPGRPSPQGTAIGGGSAIGGGTAIGGSTSTGGNSNLGGTSSGGVTSTGGTSNGGEGGSAGAPGGGGTGTSADPCDSCILAKCAAPIAACDANADCAALTKCVDACADDPCMDNCYNSHPAALALDDAIGDCIFTTCATECQF